MVPKSNRASYLRFLSTTFLLNRSTRKADKIPLKRLIRASNESTNTGPGSVATWMVSGRALATPKEDKHPIKKFDNLFMATL